MHSLLVSYDSISHVSRMHSLLVSYDSWLDCLNFSHVSESRKKLEQPQLVKIWKLFVRNDDGFSFMLHPSLHVSGFSEFAMNSFSRVL